MNDAVEKLTKAAVCCMLISFSTVLLTGAAILVGIAIIGN